jgi:hypothetical protein
VIPRAATLTLTELDTQKKYRNSPLGKAGVWAGLSVPVAASDALRADDHIITEETRTYRGGTMPVRVTELWLGEGMVYIPFLFSYPDG